MECYRYGRNNRIADFVGIVVVIITVDLAGNFDFAGAGACFVNEQGTSKFVVDKNVSGNLAKRAKGRVGNSGGYSEGGAVECLVGRYV